MLKQVWSSSNCLGREMKRWYSRCRRNKKSAMWCTADGAGVRTTDRLNWLLGHFIIKHTLVEWYATFTYLSTLFLRSGDRRHPPLLVVHFLRSSGHQYCRKVVKQRSSILTSSFVHFYSLLESFECPQE
jgi:hypothetical protein